MVIYAAQGLKDRKQAYDLLALAAGEHWGMEELPAIARAAGGKPFFPAHEDRCFNLSHSGTMAVCALDDRPVGVDIQVVKRWRPGLPGKICTPEELAWTQRQADPGLGFAMLWALKESRAKYTGEGLLPSAAVIQALRVPLPEGERSMRLDGLWFCLYAGPDWAAAVCGQSKPPEEIFWRK